METHSDDWVSTEYNYSETQFNQSSQNKCRSIVILILSCMHACTAVVIVCVGFAVDDGASVGLPAEGVHSESPETLAGAQPLPRPLRPPRNLGRQSIPVGDVQVHEGEVWGG